MLATQQPHPQTRSGRNTIWSRIPMEAAPEPVVYTDDEMELDEELEAVARYEECRMVLGMSESLTNFVEAERTNPATRAGTFMRLAHESLILRMNVPARVGAQRRAGLGHSQLSGASGARSGEETSTATVRRCISPGTHKPVACIPRCGADRNGRNEQQLRLRRLVCPPLRLSCNTPPLPGCPSCSVRDELFMRYVCDGL